MIQIGLLIFVTSLIAVGLFMLRRQMHRQINHVMHVLSENDQSERKTLKLQKATSEPLVLGEAAKRTID